VASGWDGGFDPG
jgi:transposase-like protein